MTGYDQRLYMGQGKIVLEYNLSSRQFVRSLVTKGEIEDLFYDVREQRLRVATNSGVWEYPPNQSEPFSIDSLVKPAVDREKLEGAKPVSMAQSGWFSLPFPWYYGPKGVRDRYLQWAPVSRAVVVGRDDLFLTTHGLGVFSGSLERRSIKPLWAGVDYEKTTRLSVIDGQIWMTGATAQNPITRCKTNFQAWETYYPGLESGLSHGTVRDILSFQGNIVLATGMGVSIYSPTENHFRNEGVERGLSGMSVLSLAVWKGLLVAGTSAGLYIRSETGAWEAIAHPIAALKYNDLSVGSEGLWAATSRGLYIWNGVNWSQPGRSKQTQGLAILAVQAHEKEVYWSDGKKLSRNLGSPSEVMAKAQIDKLRLYDNNLILAVSKSQIIAFDTRLGATSEIGLGENLPGTEMRDAELAGDYLWILTDQALARLAWKTYRPL